MLFTAMVAAQEEKINHWALLVAGSDNIWNYRHQADVCRGYQVLISKGFPKENIVVMVDDNFENGDDNPTPGTLFNTPDAIDVYSTCNIDYRGDDVSPDNFMAVLRGDSAATKGKKVFNSDENSHIFVYFSDHGNPGVLQFPGPRFIYGDQLNKTLDYMYQNKKYKRMVMYIEACHSASLFQGTLPDNIGIYVMTSAAADEESLGKYCFWDNIIINDQQYPYCLSDQFSDAWMSDAESADPLTNTLELQY